MSSMIAVTLALAAAAAVDTDTVAAADFYWSSANQQEKHVERQAVQNVADDRVAAAAAGY